MGWQKARQRYRKKQTANSQSSEDMIARRALRGLGLVERQLPVAEDAVCGGADFDSALWIRVKAVLIALWRQHGPLWLSRYYAEPAALETTADHKPVMLRIDELGWPGEVRGKLPILFTRVKGTRTALTYVVMSSSNVGTRLTPPVTAICQRQDTDNYCWWLVAQNTTHFLQQFGPYAWESNG